MKKKKLKEAGLPLEINCICMFKPVPKKIIKFFYVLRCTLSFRLLHTLALYSAKLLLSRGTKISDDIFLKKITIFKYVQIKKSSENDDPAKM